MIISRTPLRISFVGGGTDLKAYYSMADGKVLSSGIDKYIYVAVKRQIGIVEYKYRINWSKVEFKNDIEDIEHPIVREALKLLGIDFPIEISTFSDVPANTGLGSSSTFAVGLLHSLFALQGKMITKSKLAELAAEIEVDILNRPIGKQDHYAAAYGSFNVFTFHSDNSVSVEPVFYRTEIIKRLESHLLLLYTKQKRNSCDILIEQSKKTIEKFDILTQMKNLVDPLREVLSGKVDLLEFGSILHAGWEYKRQILPEISSRSIDTYYNEARNFGAIGGKLLGAGGGGFLLLFVEPEKQKQIINHFSDLYNLPFKFDFAGTRITYYDQSNL